MDYIPPNHNAWSAIRLAPFFSFYGSKWQAIRHYPVPTESHIIEPFAGSASYSLCYPGRSIILNDADPVIAGIWSYLIHVTSAEIMRIPSSFENVDDLHIPQEARWLVGFWLNRQNHHPCKTASAWMRQGIYPHSFWGASKRLRIARQVPYIRHWQITQLPYENLPTCSATWFVDPPYNNRAGSVYTKQVEHIPLGSWCRSLVRQTIVCEQVGATWLDFVPLGADVRSLKKGKSAEAIWVG